MLSFDHAIGTWVLLTPVVWMFGHIEIHYMKTKFRYGLLFFHVEAILTIAVLKFWNILN